MPTVRSAPKNTRRRRRNGSVRVAIIGVGNCASSLVQGVQYYRDAPEDEHVPNSAGVVIDAVRLAKLGLDHGLSGPLIEPSAYLMKAPPRQTADAQAHELLERFIRKYPRPAAGRRRSGSAQAAQ